MSKGHLTGSNGQRYTVSGITVSTKFEKMVLKDHLAALRAYERDRKIDWLAANPSLWVTLEKMPVGTARSYAWYRLKREARAAGLYSQKTNLCDINLRHLFEEARKKI